MLFSTERSDLLERTNIRDLPVTLKLSYAGQPEWIRDPSSGHGSSKGSVVAVKQAGMEPGSLLDLLVTEKPIKKILKDLLVQS